MSVQERPKDGMFSRFTGPVMDQIRALVPDFPAQKPEPDANKMYNRLIRLARVKKMIEAQKAAGNTTVTRLPDQVTCSGRSYRCTYQPVMGEIDLVDGAQNPMELLHILAHYLQPAGGPWHGGEFGSVFLTLIDRQYGPDMKRAAKDIMVANKIKTSVRSPATREKQAARYYERKIEKAPPALARILQEMRELQEGIGDG